MSKAEPPRYCLVTRKRCGSALVCHMIRCAKSPGAILRPITERYLTTAEKYHDHMEQQRKGLKS